LAITAPVDGAGGDAGGTGKGDVHEPLVVPEIQVGLRAVVGDEAFAVLVRVHRPSVHVDIRVQLLHRDLEAPVTQEATECGGGDAFSDGRDDASGDKDIFDGFRGGRLGRLGGFGGGGGCGADFGH
jgi:hypothetical protein